ncbi:hypothetical protein D3C86_1136680 [compost metagenome]
MTRSSFVKSVPIQLWVIIEGGSLMLRSRAGIQFHTSFFRFRNTIPLSLAGDVIRIIARSIPFDQVLHCISRLHVGRIVLITISACMVVPRIFSSAFLTISFASCEKDLKKDRIKNIMVANRIYMANFCYWYELCYKLNRH